MGYCGVIGLAMTGYFRLSELAGGGVALCEIVGVVVDCYGLVVGYFRLSGCLRLSAIIVSWGSELVLFVLVGL